MLTFLVAACSSGTTSSSGSPNGFGTSATDPKDGTGTALGPACEEYFACCADLAAKRPQLAMSCDSTKKQIENAEANGISTSSLEASCASGVEAFHRAGYCGDKASPIDQAPPPPPKKCAPSCTRDTDCANSCPAISGGVQCCDLKTRSCFGSKTAACPKPDTGGGDPPPSY